MSFTELSSRIVTTRKAHRCEWCDEIIPAKSKDIPYRSFVCDDRIMDGWMHPECKAAMSDVSYFELEDGWAPGDYQRGSSEPR